MSQNTVTVHAAGSSIKAPGAALPKNIQWMPPGKQKVQPLGFDVPFEMDVTPHIATEAERQLQQLRTVHAAGADVEPYGDFNHEDRARAFTAKRFFWGGDDPKDGGVRLEVEWTGAGAQAVQNGEQNVISPSWTLNKITKAFLGIKTNVGGLVPRSAFNAMQAFAKAGTETASAQANTDHAFLVMARVYGERNGIADETNAQTAFAKTALGNRTYLDYTTWLSKQPPTVAEAKPANARAEAAFEAQAKAYGAANGITDPIEAQAKFARTQQGRALYDVYCKSLQ